MNRHSSAEKYNYETTMKLINIIFGNVCLLIIFVIFINYLLPEKQLTLTKTQATSGQTKQGQTNQEAFAEIRGI